jgi:hypothetical protein
MRQHAFDHKANHAYSWLGIVEEVAFQLDQQL